MTESDKTLAAYNKQEDYKDAVHAALARFSDREKFPNQMSVDLSYLLTTELGVRGLCIYRVRRR
jgi:hypothetical protein